MKQPFVFLENLDQEIPTIPPDSIVSRTLVNTAEIKVILFGFAAGQELSEHTSARPVVLHFLRGAARLVLGDEPHAAQAGTFVQLPARLAHSVFADSEVVMLLVMVAAHE